MRDLFTVEQINEVYSLENELDESGFGYYTNLIAIQFIKNANLYNIKRLYLEDGIQLTIKALFPREIANKGIRVEEIFDQMKSDVEECNEGEYTTVREIPIRDFQVLINQVAKFIVNTFGNFNNSEVGLTKYEEEKEEGNNGDVMMEFSFKATEWIK